MKHASKFLAFLFLLPFCFQAADGRWSKQNSGTLAWLHSIYFLNENKGWIVGSKGAFLVTNDGGKSWTQGLKFTTDTIRDVYFAPTDARSGWILCERDLFSGSGEASVSYLMKTSDGGASWEKIEFGEAGNSGGAAGGGRERVARIFFSKNGSGFAVGEFGAFFALGDDGRTWKKALVPSRYLLLDGIFIDETRGALVGGGQTILFTEDAGLTWNKATVSGSGGAAARLSAVFFVNEKTGWAVGAGGKIYFTVNGGKFWREQSSGVGRDLTDVHFLNTAEGWAIGDRGAILHTTTGGNVWNAVESGVRHRLEKILFVGRKGFAVGFGGTILVYDANK
jgi:photosystem II stability/assembly factor-like uncharacterized protein